MKELILENPPRKKGKKRRTAAQRRATAKMIAAARAKRRGKKSSKRKSTKRHTVKKRSTRKTYKSMARKSRKSTRRRKASRRRKTHTYLVRGTASPIKLNGMLGGIFSKDNLTVAGGAVAATVVTNYALGTDMAQKLPGLSTNPYARAAYMLLVPVLGGVVTKRFSPNLAKGMIIGGLANGIAQLLTAAKVGPAGIAVPTVTATGPALTSGAGEYLGEYLGAYGDETDSDVGSVGAFADSAWN